MTEVDYGTVLGVDTFMHVPFIKRIGSDLVVTWQQGLEDEDTKGQSIQMKYKTNSGAWSSRMEVIPAFSDSGSTNEIILINLEMIEVDGTFYYLASVCDTNGLSTVQNWSAVGIIAVERTGSGTVGTPFWVHTPSGSAPTPEATFPSYTFDEPISGNIRAKIESNDYQIFMYPDTDNDFYGELTDGSDIFYEMSAVKVNDGITRVSRDFTSSTARAFFDFGDGVPVVSAIPSSPARQSLEKLRDNRISMVGGSTDSDRKQLWFSFADLNTLNFEDENTYRVVYGSDTGQVFAGAFKNGLWSYPNHIHDTDNKIKIVCSKYKEGIFLFEFDYADIQP
jgi:hypothetical protein